MVIPRHIPNKMETRYQIIFFSLANAASGGTRGRN